MSDAVVVVQARVGSMRLPGKVLLPIGERPMVAHVMERAAQVGPPVVLATSDDPSDDSLVALAASERWRVVRGSREDVLARFLLAVTPTARYVVRLTADCPLLDPAIVRATLAVLRETTADYVSNTLEPTYPDGVDCEALTAESLRRAAAQATRPSDREHVTPYLWRQPDLFHLVGLVHRPDLAAERWTVDDARDLEFVRALYDRLGLLSVERRTSMYTVLDILRREPHLRDLNRGTTRNEGYLRSIAAEGRGGPRG